MDLSTLRVQLTADPSQLVQGLQRAGVSVKSLGREISVIDSLGSRLDVTGAVNDNTQAMQRAVGAFAGIREAANSAADSARAFEAALGAGDRVRALHASLDPLVAATQRYEAAVEQVNHALSLNAVSQAQATQVLALAKARHDAVAGSMTRMGQSSGMAAANVSNLGAQFQDIFVMLAAGQNPFQLAIQQGSQISQVLGPMGARGAVQALGQAFLGLINPVTFVTIGAIAGGATLLQWLMGVGKEAEDLDDTMDRLSASVGAYRQAARQARMSTSELREEFGSATSEARDLMVSLENAARARALADIATQADALGSSLNVVEDLIPRVLGPLGRAGSARSGQANAIDAYEQAVSDLADRLQVSDEAATELYGSLQVLMRAEGPDHFVDAATDLRDRMLEAGVAITDEVIVGLEELIQKILEAEGVANRVSRRAANQTANYEMNTGSRSQLANLREAVDAGIVELIRYVEGTSGARGFNTSLDNGQWLPGGREHALTTMTLREILELQRHMLRQPGNAARHGDPSSALGVGQFTGTTMGGSYFTGDRADGTGLIGALGLSLDDVFSEEVQIAMIGELLRRRNGQGLVGLRNEWEGLNNVSDQVILQALAADTDALTEAQERFNDSRRGFIGTAEDFIEGHREARSAVDDLRASIDPAAERILALADAQAAVDEAIRHNAMSAAEGAAFMRDFTAAYDADVTEDQAKQIDAAQSALDRLRGSLDPAIAATLEYAEAQRLINEARAAGVAISADEERGILAGIRAQQIAASAAGQASIEAAEDAREAQEQAAEAYRDIWQSTTDDIVSWMQDGFQGGFDGLLDIGKSVLSQLIAHYRANPLPIQAAGGGGGGGLLGGITSALGGPVGILGSLGMGLFSMFQRRRQQRREEREAEERAEEQAALAQQQKEQSEGSSLWTRQFELQGRTGRLRGRELALLEPANRALQKRIWAIEDEKAAEEEAARAAEVRKSERSGLWQQLREAQGDVAKLREIELRALDPANRSLQERIWAIQDEQKVINEREGLEQRLLELQGDTAALRALELAALDPANQALQEMIWGLEDAALVAEERKGLEQRLLELQGDTAALRAQELAALDPANQALQEMVWGLEDAAAVANEREGLEERLLELQGNTAELRRRELEALDLTNRALQEMIWGLEDAAAAMDALNPSDFASLFDFERMRAGAANSVAAPGSSSTVVPLVSAPVAAAPVSDPNTAALLAEVKDMNSRLTQLGMQIEQHAYTLASLAKKDDQIGTPPVRAA